MTGTWFKLSIFVLVVCAIAYFILPDHRQRGHQLAKEKLYRQAIAAYEKYLEGRTDEESVDVLESMARIYWHDPDKAIDLWERVRAVKGDEIEPLKNLAELYEWRQRPAEAIKVLETLRGMNPENESYMVRLGTIYIANPGGGNKQKAVGIYKQLVERRPDDAQMHETLADLYKWTGNHAGAIATYRTMRERFPAKRPEVMRSLGEAYAATADPADQHHAIKAFEEYLELRPRDEKIRRLIADLHVWQSQILKSLTHRKALHDLFPDNPRYRNELVAAYKEYRQHEALALLYEAEAAKAPDDAALLFEIARAYRGAGRTDKAVAYLNKAQATGKAGQEVYTMLAQIRRERQQFEEEKAALLATLKTFPRDPAALRRLAELHEANKEFEEAAAYFERLIAVAPEDPAARGALTRLYLALRKPDEGIRHAAFLAKIAPKDAEILEQLTNLYDWTGRAALAARIYEQRIGLLDPKKPVDRRLLPPMYLRLARMYTQLESHDRAVAQVKKAHEIEPKNVRILLELADAYERNGDRTQRVNVYMNIVAADPGNIEYQLALADALNASREYIRAVGIYSRLLAADPNNIQISLLLASSYEDSGRTLDAIRIHRQLSERSPRDTNILNDIGDRYLWIGDRERGRQFFAKVLAIDANNLRAIKQLARVAAWNNDIRRAEAYYRKFIALGGRDFEVHFLLGELYYDNRRPAQGFREHDTALAIIRTRLPDVLERLTMARVAFRRGRLLAAIRMHEALIRKYPSDERIREDFLEMLVLAHDYPRAERVATQLAKTHPRSERGRRLLGRIYLETGRYDKAAAQISEILRMRPNDPGLKVDLARAYMETGRKPEALPLLQQAMASGVDTTSEIREIRDLYATSLTTEFRYVNAPKSEERFSELARFRHWIDRNTRLLVETRATHYKKKATPLNRKIRDSVLGQFVRVDYDLDRRTRLYAGGGMEQDGTDRTLNYLLGAIFKPVRGSSVELYHSAGRVADDPVEFLNVHGRRSRTALQGEAQLARRWKLSGGAAYSRYTIRGSENVIDGRDNFGYQTEYTGGVEYMILESPHFLSVAYGYRNARFNLKNGALDTLVPVLTAQTVNGLSARWEHQHTRKFFHGITAGFGYDSSRSLPVFATEIDLQYRFTEDIKATLRLLYLGESAQTGGGDEFEVIAGLEWNF